MESDLLCLCQLIGLQEYISQALPHRLIHTRGLHIGKPFFDVDSLPKLGNCILSRNRSPEVLSSQKIWVYSKPLHNLWLSQYR